MFKTNFPFFRQLDVMDCAPTCLKMVCKYYGKLLDSQTLRELCDKGPQGTSLFSVSKAAKEVGLETSAHKLSVNNFIQRAKLPCILHWKGNHFVVAYKVTKDRIYIADPGAGKIVLSISEFTDFWTFDGQHGFALFCTPGVEFKQIKGSDHTNNNGLLKLLRHLTLHKKLLLQLGLGAFVTSVLSLIVPFLTQTLVDQGIGNRDVELIYLILIAQLMVFLGKTITEFIRSWILVHVGSRVNISVLSDFLRKLLQLPLSYFEAKNLGDILQRVADHQKIESFLTSHSLNIIFSVVNLVAFSIIMGMYSGVILTTFFIGTCLSVLWVFLFLKKRKYIDYQKFEVMSRNQSAIMQLVEGVSEVKLNQGENRKVISWQKLQCKLFDVKLKSLAIEQYQQAGSTFINELKNILILVIAANAVVQGEISLGMMMAITYILGQMNGPVEQFLTFVKLAQDAKIGIERLNEIECQKSEVPQTSELVQQLNHSDIHLSNVYFKYGRYDEQWILNDINLSFPVGEMTAIVGASGSGKTTLLKILLGIHNPTQGQIEVGEVPLKLISPDVWREKCGVVLQDGYLFSDTIVGNICLSSEKPDMARVIHAAKTANVHEEISKFPQGYFTKVGNEGLGLSGGQKQRILIARAVYKNPQYLFFDEATSSLDANNERAIQDNLTYFLQGRTSIVIAHRLSTVKHAKQIIVLDKGKVVEVGKHDQLCKAQGVYFNLVQNQLELGT